MLVNVVTATYELESAIIGNELIGVFNYQQKAFDALHNYDVKNEIMKVFDGDVVVGKPFTSFGHDDSVTWYQETYFIKTNKNDQTEDIGTVILSIYEKELA